MGHEWPRVPDELAGQTGYLLSRAGFAVRGMFAQRLAGLGISPRDFGVLSLLDARESLTQQGLGAELGIDPSTTVAIVDHLEQAGLLERRRHPTDRRANALHVTKAGKLTLKKARAMVDTANDDVFGRLSPEERQTLHDLLARLLADR